LRVVQLVLAAAWWAGSTAVCVAASRVIYGLRLEVSEVRRLGQYHLEEKLGEGGMGVVYRAHHALLQRPTAVKLLPPERIGERGLERFELEVRQTARLSHPNTITIFDYGHTPDGVFYYAMELLEGVTLDRVVASTGPMPPARVLHILRQAAGSLAEAHAIGLAHRDIKPENIMLCQQGGVPDTVKVLDFGLVKEVARDEAAKLTGTNVIMGTPQYMAPEAIVRPDDVDGRADLYALAASAYYLLTGRDVFQATSVVELCSHHLHSAPEPPSKHVEGIPADLEALLLRCLAKKPEDRPRDGRELARLLAHCGDGLEWNEELAAGWWTRHGRSLARPGGVSPTAPTLLAESREHKRVGA
jgi:serine/threonine-protein kinase